MRFLSLIKTYWTALVGAVLGVLAIAVNVLAKRGKTLKRQRDTAEAGREHAIDVIEGDIEVEEQVDKRLSDAAHEISQGSAPSELTNPNDDWLRKARKD